MALSLVQSWIESKGYPEHLGFKVAYILQIFCSKKDHAFPESQQLKHQILKALHIYKVTFQTDPSNLCRWTPQLEIFVYLDFFFFRPSMYLFLILFHFATWSFGNNWFKQLLPSSSYMFMSLQVLIVCVCVCADRRRWRRKSVRK